ncbi:MAG: hypothetical protein MK133_04680, partial [Planctomycetes bacterium]|nr:hypothetical protein [Planctomycetota bacterium]
MISGRRGRLREIRQLRSGLQELLAGLAKKFAEVNPRPEPEPRLRWRRRASAPAGFLSASLLVLAAVVLLWFGIFQPAGIVERERERRDERDLGIKVLEPSLRLKELLNTETGKGSLGGRLDADEEKLIQLIGEMAALERDAGALTLDKEKAEKANEAGWNWYQVQGNSDRVQELLRRFYHYREVLLFVFLRYERIANFNSDEVAADLLLLRAFLVEYVAGTVLFETSLKFVNGFNAENTRAKLNEGIQQWGIPPGFYNFVRDGLRSPENLGLFKEFESRYHASPIKDELGRVASYEQLQPVIRAAEETITRYAESSSQRVVRRAHDQIKERSKEVVYQAQKAISSWIGDFKTIQGDSAIKGSAGFDELLQRMEPGDIILERRNYYGSNAFLPGYWPHAALYIGTAEDLRELGLTEESLRTGFGQDLERANTFWEKYTSP